MSKHTEEKKQRIEHYEHIRLSMKDQGFHEKQCTVSFVKANVMAFITAGPIVFLCGTLFLMRWDEIHLPISLSLPLFFLVAMLLMVMIHELIHGLTFSLFCKNKWNSIHIGVMWNILTPYCHCKEILKGGCYLLGVLMPLILLGFGLFAVSLVTGNVFILMLSMVNILGAGGDLVMALLLLKHKDALIVDHPTECGFIAFYR